MRRFRGFVLALLLIELPGQSGTAIALGSVTGVVGASFPLAIGLLAGRFGLGAAMWVLLAAPAALLALTPRASRA
ncbi:MAG: hypothetical protein ACRDQ2_04340 [Gaiellales bacterium]